LVVVVVMVVVVVPLNIQSGPDMSS
jgi:hypothetical protein